MEKTEAGLERPLYEASVSEKKMSNHKYLLHNNDNIIVNYGFRCHGDKHYNHTTLPDRTMNLYLDGFYRAMLAQSAVMRQ